MLLFLSNICHISLNKTESCAKILFMLCETGNMMFNIEIYKKKSFRFFFGLVEGMVFFFCLSSCQIYFFYIYSN